MYDHSEDTSTEPQGQPSPGFCPTCGHPNLPPEDPRTDDELLDATRSLHASLEAVINQIPHNDPDWVTPNFGKTPLRTNRASGTEPPLDPSMGKRGRSARTAKAAGNGPATTTG